MSTCFQFDKLGPLVTSPVMPGPGPYYTCVVKMTDVESFPFDYALFFSPDHDDNDGGIWLYVCEGDPSIAANWMSYDDAFASRRFSHIPRKPSANPIFLDRVQGDGHTETPYANVIDGTVYLTYHKNNCGHSQSTLLATSTDGINFFRHNGEDDSIILDYEPSERHGNGHTGYFRWAPNPFPGVRERYVGYSLHGGGDDFHSAIWGSNNTIAWERLDVLDPILGFAVPREDVEIIWHEIDPASITKLDDDEFVALCGVGTRASGGVERLTELYEIFLGPDGRTLKRHCRKILSVAPSAEDAEELAQPTTIDIGERKLLIYVGAKETGSTNTVMAATGIFDRTAELPPVLPYREQQKHIQKP